jgi:DNA-binding MarR family transcriptional regulator
MRQLLTDGPQPPSELARRIYLSQATVTGILNRLENRSLIKRERIGPDRRVVTISLTDHGSELVKVAPLPLQKHFYDRLNEMPEKKQLQITKILAQVVEMMESQDIVNGEAALPHGTSVGNQRVTEAPANGRDKPARIQRSRRTTGGD